MRRVSSRKRLMCGLMGPCGLTLVMCLSWLAVGSSSSSLSHLPGL